MGSMKYLFMGSLFGDKENYQKIVDFLASDGHISVSDHFLTRKKEDLDKETPAEAELYSKKVGAWLQSADVLVIEVSEPFVSAGYLIATALEQHKPVVILYKEKFGLPPYGLKGINNKRLQIHSYTDAKLKETLRHAMDTAESMMDVHFNFPIPSRLSTFLSTASQRRSMTRATYLKSLLEREMSKVDAKN